MTALAHDAKPVCHMAAYNLPALSVEIKVGEIDRTLSAVGKAGWRCQPITEPHESSQLTPLQEDPCALNIWLLLSFYSLLAAIIGAGLMAALEKEKSMPLPSKPRRAGSRRYPFFAGAV